MTVDNTMAPSGDEVHAEVMREYQCSGILKSAVESKRIDAFDDDNGPSGPEADNLMLKPRSWSDGKYLSIFPHGRVLDDDMKDAAHNIGQAAARRDDQLILDAPASVGTLSTVGAAGIDVTFETLAQAMRILADKGDLMRNQACVACPSLWYSKLRQEDKAEWSDYAESKNNIGTISFRVGEKEFNCRLEFIPDYSGMGGFDPTQGVGYAFTKDSIVLGHATGPTGDIAWVPQRRSFLVMGRMIADAVVQRPEGIVKILGQTAQH